jgi:hypothetical protein
MTGRDRIELVLELFDAVRRNDHGLLERRLYDDVVWQGLTEDTRCEGPEAAAAALIDRRAVLQEVETLTLSLADHRVVVHFGGPGVVGCDGITLLDGLYSVFAVDDRKIIRIEDHSDRERAFAMDPVSPE